jgi:cupin fold WbuC family metalloprotein
MRVVTQIDLDELTAVARTSPRKRQHLNIHRDHEDPCQRLLNAIGVESYIRPHRHAMAGKHESLFAVRGEFALFQFGEQGSVERMIRMAATPSMGSNQEAVGVEVEPREWHTVVALEEGSVLLEIKAGPYQPGAAKEFAPWAPTEGAADAKAYLAYLRSLAIGTGVAT